jgi:uncharacterized membrane protein (UPF0127 family)
MTYGPGTSRQLPPMPTFLTRCLRTLLPALLLILPVAACADDSRLVIHSANGDHRFTVEVVDTDEGRAKGLMFRQHLDPDAGMLFDFKANRPVSFWMQNTYIPLDMLFIAANGVIRNIQVNARPFDTTSIPSDGPVTFVLEVPGGRTVALGIKAGDIVEQQRIKAGGQ